MATTASMRASDARADGAVRDISFARGEILIRRRVHGIEMKVGVAASAYRGVVLSLVDLPSGQALYRIRLAHRDADLDVTLHEAADDRDIVAEWKFWAKRFALPKFILPPVEIIDIQGVNLSFCRLGQITERTRFFNTEAERKLPALAGAILSEIEQDDVGQQVV